LVVVVIVGYDYCCCVREVLCRESSLYSGSLGGCEDQPCNWVCREGKEREREKEICI